MKTKVRMFPKFIVNAEKKTVVCIIEANIMTGYAESILDDYLFKNRYSFDKKHPNINRMGYFTIKATAKCHGDDKFDEKLGRRIAESKAKAKVFKTARKVWEDVKNYNLQEINKIAQLVENCSYAERREREHIIDLVFN